MPKKFSDDPTPDESTQSPSGFGSLRNWLAGGLRMGSGLLSGEGMLPGALISGAGETLAELAEGSPLSPSRIAVEAGIGAVPLGKILKAGHAIESGLKSGALSGVGEAGRELARGETLNPKQIATSAGIGGLTGGALSKVLGMGAPKVAEKAGTEFEVVPTTQIGPGTGVLKDQKKGGLVPSNPLRKTIQSEVNPRKSTEIPYRMEEPKAEVPGNLTNEREGRVPYTNVGPEPYRPSAKAAQKVEDKLNKEAADAEEIARRREETGLTEESHTSSSTLSTPGERFTTTYSEPKAKGQGDTADFIPPTKPTATPSTPAPTKEATPLEKILNVGKKSKSSKTVEGFNNQVDKVLEGTEPPPTAAAPLESNLSDSNLPESNPFSVARAKREADAEFNEARAKTFRETGRVLPREIKIDPDQLIDESESPVSVLRKILEPGEEFVNPDMKNPGGLLKTRQGAVGLNRRMAEGTSAEPSARDAYLIEQGKAPEGPLAPPNEVKDPEQWIKDEHNYLDRLKGESGEINPSLLRLLTGATGAAIGAPIGAANSNEEDKLEGALKGAAIGGGLGLVSPSVVGALSHPEGLVEGLSGLGRKLPSIQRANLLTSQHGLPANAIAGPYGSMFMSGIEKSLAGDPAGREILKNSNPIEFLKQMPKHFEEARGLIGRAEGTALNQAATPSEKLLGLPGTLMTTGDATARDILTRSGVPEEAARDITLTNEPYTQSAKKLANLTKKTGLLQMMFPFSRTTANIAEQGAKRIPGLGMFVSHFMEKGGAPADTLRTKLIQQGLGGAMMGGSGVLGANIEDPDTAKIVKRYLSNAGGQYSLPASIGFSAGQAIAQGKKPISGGFRELADALPLPSARPIQDILTTGSDLADYTSDEKDFNQVRIPHSAYPAFLRELDPDALKQFFNPANPNSLINKPTTKKFIDDTEP